jgi:GT2 family glycosyltransferase
VSYRGWDRLNKCLETLNSYQGKDFKAEVIIVDNKSEDETILKIEKKFPKFRFINNHINGGFANGCNLGAKNAVGEYVLFLNPDTVADEAEVNKLLNMARQNPQFGIVSCRQVNEKGKECKAYGTFPSLFNLTGFQRAILNPRQSAIVNPQSEIICPDWVSGSVILMRLETFSKVSGFDEDFWMYFEDVDLCRRIRNTGFEIAFCTNITIEHNHGGSSRINLNTASITKTEVHISRHVYLQKHKKGFEKILIQIFLVVNNIISGGVMAIIGLLLFFIPKVFSRTLIFYKLTSYYLGSLLRLSFLSRRSVNFQKKYNYA